MVFMSSREDIPLVYSTFVAESMIRVKQKRSKQTAKESTYPWSW
jgi:hypothetical protein